MNVRIWFAILAMSASPMASHAAPAMSAPMTLAEDGVQTLNLDAPDDRVSAWNRDQLAGINTIRGKFTARRLNGQEATTPATFLVELTNGGADTVNFMAFAPEGKSVLIPVLFHSAKPKDEVCFAGSAMVSGFDLNETVELEINWTKAGALQLFLRDKASRRINNDAERCSLTMVGGPPTALKVSAISGRGEWTPLTLGATEPAP